MATPHFKAKVRGVVRTGTNTLVSDWDARYLRKDAAAGAQTVAGGAVTFASAVTLSAGVTVSGTATVGTLSATTINGAALSGTFTGSPTVSAAGAVAASIQRSGAAGVAFQVGDGTALANYTVTAAGGFTASATSTINAAGAGLTINQSGAGAIAFQIFNSAAANSLSMNTNGNTMVFGSGTSTLTITTGAVMFSTGSGIASQGFQHNTANPTFVFYSSAGGSGILSINGTGTTALTISSQVAAGANTAFTLNATNGPDTIAKFQSASGDRVSISSTGAITVGNAGAVISKAATSAALSVRNATATRADLNLNQLTADPGTVATGDWWYRSDLHEIRVREGATTYKAALVAA